MPVYAPDSYPASGAPEYVQLRGRMRYTRWFIAALAPLIVFNASPWPEHSLEHELMQWGGHILVVAGVMIRIYASLYVGGRKNHELVTDGPFSIVRNPLYVGSFIAMVGLGLLTISFSVTALLIVAFALCYTHTVEREELYLSRKFGDNYADYAQEVPRWIPNFSLWNAPGELTVKPYFVLRTIADGAVFFLAVPVLEALCELRIQGIFPTYLTLL
jgi:protein-S-isoprenylcysteine O-methyltransferase Ste14